MVVPLTIGRPAALTLVESQLPENKCLGIVTQIDEEKDQPQPEDLYNIGVSAQVIKLLRQPDGVVVLIVQVLNRIELKSYIQVEPFLRATVQAVETIIPPANDPTLLALFNNLRNSAIKLLELSPEIPDQARAALVSVDDPEKLADLLAGNLGIQVEAKQQMLAERDLLARIHLIQEALQRQLEIAELQQKLRKDVEGNFLIHNVPICENSFTQSSASSVKKNWQVKSKPRNCARSWWLPVQTRPCCSCR
jgi:ATP-dependent Lon protease